MYGVPAAHTERVRAQLGGDVPADTAAPRSMRELLCVSPGWPFHLICALPATALLWGATSPGTTWWALGGIVGALVLAAVWVVRLIAHGWVNGHDRRRFLIAPAGGVLVVALIAFDVPLQVRWAYAHDAFDDVVEALPAAESGKEHPRPDLPERIGGYRVTWIDRVEGGVLFHSPAPCGFIGDGGFGWFPHGPDPDALEDSGPERPEFSRIRASWYTWCASW